MLQRFFQLWHQQETLLDGMTDEFDAMLNQSENLFRLVTDALFLGGAVTGLKEQVLGDDKAINAVEQGIRRKVVTYLSTGHDTSAALSSCLILMSVVKDVERIGDYAKNIFEVFDQTKRLVPGEQHDALLAIRNAIMGHFSEVGAAFRESDEQKSRKLLGKIRDQKDACDTIVDALLNAEPAQYAVAHALLSRFFKRTLAHLGNIATSVFMPLDKLDYFDEEYLD